MAIEDRSAAFIKYAAERRFVSSARGSVVKLCRWHAPLAGRESFAVPPLRNRWDVRAWAREAGEGALPRDVESFRREAERLWLEFCAALEADGYDVTAARELVELDADARREAEARAVILSWADEFRCAMVTAADLCADDRCREAMGSAMQPPRPGDAVTPSMVTLLVRDLAARGAECEGWRVETAARDGHRKVKRWALVRLSDDQGRGEPWH